jgi:hypothetical protein
MVHHVKDISAGQRQAIEDLLGRALQDDESLVIRPSHVLKEAPTGDERTRLFRQYQNHLDQLAARVANVAEDEIDAAIDEAVGHVRHMPE